jgi:PBSX family phage terminase large subunit
MKSITLIGNGQRKEIRFDHDGKTNKKQKKYFDTLFDDNLKYRGIYDEYSYFGAFRCGKSFSQQLAVYLLCVSKANLKAVFIRDTYDQLKDSVIKQFLDEFERLGEFVYKSSERVAIFNSGAELRFRTFERDTNILSAEYDVIAVCQAEDTPKELFLQLIGRASGRVLGKKGIILTEGNPGSGWAKERYKDIFKEGLEKKRIFFIEGETADNPHVTKEYIQSLVDNYPSFWLDRYLYGLWDNREELIFSEFNEKEHVIEPIDPNIIPSDYLRRNGFDWGWVNPSTILFSFKDYDGNLVIFDEVYHSKTLPKQLKIEGNKYGRFLTPADHAMKGLKMPTQEDEKRTVWSECERDEKDEATGEVIKGLVLTECNKEELSNIVLTNTLFKQGKLLITKNCANTLREIKNWKWKRLKLGADRSMPEEPVDKDNHTCDALNYIVADIFREKSKDKKKDKSFNESFYKAVITKSNERKVTQFS